MVFGVDWNVWVFIVVSHSLPINSEENTGAQTTATWKVNNGKKRKRISVLIEHYHRGLKQHFLVEIVKQGKYTSRQLTSVSVCVPLQKYKRFDKESGSVWPNSSKGFIENGLNNQEFHPRHVNFCGIQRDVDEVLISCLFHKVSFRRFLGAERSWAKAWT